ncbi:2-succinyl-5-enolpyruvyl-6-hydroxy-3-cyclohexene-1-carboxylate synthase [Microbacterium sp. cf046]|uniref:2-succinyl-5-enolpyruvyl-6-hydroxy-3- cyclohexene-1-carboxylic-acid synthase n=1 Tax=Microbacterium sp. cf046 TaxID=1761803 RepID=UPI0008E88DED|nr:2-succinyl-5-enolpyruvyl-6-hydroxy-3-cyclohexene-1-carboxylic-acid synthase [Microbacterium sp. cf046]SFR90420.1 2-succinyl-5-enolpyruvyl-6-hydroxy-3-cyclohexene-1-carboxylate synthase [Microbacterium sp. cf046]
MYANEPLVLELTALLKAHGVKDIVISPGSRHYAFTRTLENDQDFRLHSVVDERSAAFFALGLIQATGEPAVTICTSGTAALNYGSALAEAAAQKLPLVAITTDRLPEFLGQSEDQMIDQPGLFDRFVRYAGNLRPISNERDRWYCNRVINEALVAAREGGGGPVHLNVPIASHSGVPFNKLHLPDVRVITRHRLDRGAPDWTALAERMSGRRVLLVWGQGPRPSERALAAGAAFTEVFDAAVMADHLANVHLPGGIDNPLAFLHLAAASNPDLAPEVVLTFGGNIVYKDELKAFVGRSRHEHWQVDPDGAVADPFRSLTDVIQCRPEQFLQSVVAAHAGAPAATGYADRMRSTADSIAATPTEHGELTAIGTLVRALPEASALHIANSAPIRMAQLYSIDPTVDVFCNRGVNGIDGCLSTAIGYAAVTAKPTFVVIGDLTFFYDMNSLWIRDTPANLRILLLNNGGGAVMHVPLPANYSPVAGRHVSAEHGLSARGWIESLGIEYSASSTADATADGVAWLTDMTAPGPRVLEVFSEKTADIAQLKAYYSLLGGGERALSLRQRIRRFGGNLLRRLGLR